MALGFTFTDDPLVPRTTTAKVVQLPELRSDIDTVRARLGLEPVSWTDPTLIAHVTPIKRMHVIDFRPALDAAYQKAGKPLPAYTDATIVVAQNVVKANHLNDVRGVFRTLFTPTITGPLHAGSRTVSGTGIPGSSVQLFVNGVARWAPSIVNALGQWTVANLTHALGENDVVTAQETTYPACPNPLPASGMTAPCQFPDSWVLAWTRVTYDDPRIPIPNATFFGFVINITVRPGLTTGVGTIGVRALFHASTEPSWSPDGTQLIVTGTNYATTLQFLLGSTTWVQTLTSEFEFVPVVGTIVGCLHITPNVTGAACVVPLPSVLQLVDAGTGARDGTITSPFAGIPGVRIRLVYRRYCFRVQRDPVLGAAAAGHCRHGSEWRECSAASHPTLSEHSAARCQTGPLESRRRAHRAHADHRELGADPHR